MLGALLHATAISYFVELTVLNRLLAKKLNAVNLRLPSEASFIFKLNTYSAFGVPLKIFPSGLAMDVGRNISARKALDGDNEKTLQLSLAAGQNSSALEHSVPEQFLSNPDSIAEGVSAVKALKIANNQGIPIYTVNQSNINSVLPQLQIDANIIFDIQNAVNAGKEVTVSKSNIIYSGWTGSGYIVIDPITGDGAYLISGSLNGGLYFAAWLAGLTILLILASFGLAAIAALAAIAFAAIVGFMIASLPVVVAAVLFVLPALIIAANYCMKVAKGTPKWVKAVCTIVVTIMLVK
jgi:hypothetical protein